MFCIGLLSSFNILVLITPPQSVSKVLTLMPLPVAGRYVLLAAAIINVGISMAYEEWGTPAVSTVVGLMTRWWQRGKRRTRNGKMYKVVEGGMI
jgi:cation-transporting P-type ATPase 13A2